MIVFEDVVNILRNVTLANESEEKPNGSRYSFSSFFNTAVNKYFLQFLLRKLSSSKPLQGAQGAEEFFQRE